LKTQRLKDGENARKVSGGETEDLRGEFSD